MKKRVFYSLVTVCLFALNMTACSSAPDETDVQWYEPKTEYKPYTRWWWHGSAVDKESLTYIFEEFADKGIGGVEITPIYGVQNNEENDIQYLSPEWMDMYSHVVAEGERLGIQVDMMTGTGWPFGGPEISIEDAADRYLVTKFEVKEGASLGEPVKYKEPAPQFRMPAGRRAPQRRGPQQTATSLESLMAYSSNGDIIDLTDKVAEDGTLNWVAEKGIDEMCADSYRWQHNNPNGYED